MVTIVTDNYQYCQTMIAEIRSVPHLCVQNCLFSITYLLPFLFFFFLVRRFVSVFDPKPYLTSLPEDYGSSYFDRFWKNGNKLSRFYLQYRRLPAEGEE